MAILKSLVVVAWADGHVAEEEKEVIEALLQAFEASPAEAALIKEYSSEPKTLDDIPLTDMDGDDRRVLLQHAVLLCHVDGDFSADEVKFLETLRAYLKIPAEEAKVVIDLATLRAKQNLHTL